MVGRMYVKAPVNSNMMTTTVTVIRVIPLHIGKKEVRASLQANV